MPTQFVEVPVRGLSQHWDPSIAKAQVPDAATALGIGDTHGSLSALFC